MRISRRAKRGRATVLPEEADLSFDRSRMSPESTQMITARDIRDKLQVRPLGGLRERDRHSAHHAYQDSGDQIRIIVSTTMAGHAISITPEVLQQLADLRAEPKFTEAYLYPGAPTKELGEAAQKAVNGMLDRVRSGLPHSPQNSYVISEFLEMLKAFESADTEEREQACFYCERVMEIVGIESSDGALNTWLYGFDPER